MGCFFFRFDTRLTHPATAIPTIIRDRSDGLPTRRQEVRSQLASVIT